MMLYQKNNSSEEIMNMDMEYEQKARFHKDRCSRQSGILVILGVCMIIFMAMTFVIFAHQQKTFLMLESWMNSHGSNLTSVKPDLQITDQPTSEKSMQVQEKSKIETLMTNLASSLSSIMSKQEENLQKLERQDASHTEVKSLMVGLSSAVSALTSKLNDAVGNQDQKQTETKKLLDSLSSSVTFLQSDQQNKQRNFESLSSSLSDLKSSISDLNSSLTSISSQLLVTKQDVSQTDVKSLMNSLSSAVSALTAQLNDAVNKQDQKQSETERSLDSLKSSVQSDQQNRQRDIESLSSSLSDLRSSISNLTSSVVITLQQQDVKSLMNSLNFTVSALTSTLNDAVKKQDQKQTETERSLDSLKSSVQSDQQNKQRDLESLKSSLNDLKRSVSDLASSVASLSSQQQTSEERVMNALKELASNTSAKKTDVSVPNCKSGWITYESSCFFFSNNKVNWSEARDYCKEQGALLLKIQDNDKEWAFLNAQTTNTFFWVGLTDQTTGNWRWADETPYIMNKERWNPGQPDDWKEHGLGEEGEDCGQIAYSGKLNDNHCSVKMRFICRVQF